VVQGCCSLPATAKGPLSFAVKPSPGTKRGDDNVEGEGREVVNEEEEDVEEAVSKM